MTKALKAADQMEWVRRRNSVRNRAEEVILGKYHCPQTCHGHIGSNPVFTALDSRKGVHAARLISLINVPDDLYIQFSRFNEAALLIGRRTPSKGKGKKQVNL